MFRASRKFPFIRLNPPQVLALGFLAIILIGSALLMLPLAASDGTSRSYLNALFMAAAGIVPGTTHLARGAEPQSSWAGSALSSFPIC